MRYTAYVGVWTFIVYISSIQTASACTIQTGSPRNGGGSCDFTDVKASGYAFDGYWTTFSRPYSYIGAYIPGSRTGSTEKFYGLYDFGHRKNDKKTLTSPRIPAGRYCLGFWFYKTGSSSILTVSLASTNTVSQLWNVTKSNVSTWIYKTMELDINSNNDSRVVFSADDPPGFFDSNTVAVDDIILSKVLSTTLTTTPTTKTTTTPKSQSTTTYTKTSTTGQTKSTLTVTTKKIIKPTTNLKTTVKMERSSTLTTMPTTTQTVQTTTNQRTKRTSILTTKPKPIITTSPTSTLITKITTTRTDMPTTKRTTKLSTMLTTMPRSTLSRTPTKTAATQVTTVPTTTLTTPQTATNTMKPTTNLTTIQTTTLTIIPTTASSPNISEGTRQVTPSSTTTTVIPTQPTSQKPGINLDSAIHVACEHDRWNVTVDMNQLKHLYPGIQQDSIYLGSTSCKGVIASGILKFQQSLQTCSTTETKTNTSFNFRNKVVYAESDPLFPFIIRRHVWDLMVECDVLRETIVHTHVLHENLQLAGTAVTPPPQHSAISLAFYRDRHFLHSISGPPLHIKVGDTVYAKAYILTQKTDVKLVLHSCYMTPQPNATDTLKYFIINNGCVTDPNTHIISYSQHEIRFVFQEIEYSSNPEGLDIYCNASLCDVTDYSTRCSAVCISEPLIG